MPFVNIRSQQRKDEISKRVADAISDVLQLPKDEIWIVFEDIPAGDWYVGSTAVAELRKKTQKGVCAELGCQPRRILRAALQAGMA
jgi:4-oxalocrotonate tautomerase